MDEGAVIGDERHRRGHKAEGDIGRFLWHLSLPKGLDARSEAVRALKHAIDNRPLPHAPTAVFLPQSICITRSKTKNDFPHFGGPQDDCQADAGY